MQGNGTAGPKNYMARCSSARISCRGGKPSFVHHQQEYQKYTLSTGESSAGINRAKWGLHLSA